MTEIQRHEKIAGIWSRVILIGGTVIFVLLVAYAAMIAR